MLLSIIVPIYNRSLMVETLYQELQKFDFEDVEIILVDDGSTDDTVCKVKELFIFDRAKFLIYSQENKGPGGARNQGVELATGKYIWLVDSDDSFNVEAYKVLKEKEHENYDFIDFRIADVTCEEDKTKNDPQSSMHQCFHEEGEYVLTKEMSYNLKMVFGRIYTKIFRRDFWIDNNIYYPEYCIYEDNYLIFSLPFYVNRFYCSNVCAYYYHIGHESITNSTGLSSRMFDRTITAYEGFRKAISLAKDQEDIDIFCKRYINLFPTTTTFLVAREAKSQYDIKNMITSKTIIDVYLNEKKNLKKELGEFNYDDRRDGKMVGKKLRTLFKIARIFRNRKININYYYEINKQNWGKPILFRDK